MNMCRKMISKIRVIAFLMAVNIFNPIFSQDYRVYSTEGKVEKRTTRGWQTLGRGENLSADDFLKISRASTLRILDKEKKQIYTFTQKGEGALSSMVDKAKEENSTLTRRMIAESRRLASAEKSHKSLGAAKRETDDENLEAIYACVVESLKTGEDSGGMKVEKVAIEDGVVYLRFVNNTEEALFANILVSEEGEEDSQRWRPLFESGEDLAGIFINAGETLEFAHMMLADDGSRMAAVGFPLDFDIDELVDMLENGLEPLETEVKCVNVYILK